jgi:hypothetical protein
MPHPNQAQKLKFQSTIVQLRDDLDVPIARLRKHADAAKTLGMGELSAHLENAEDPDHHRQLGNLHYDLGDFVGNPAFTNRSIIDKLSELLGYAKMDSASFGFPSEKVSSSPHMEPPIVEMNVTDFIKEKTRVYRETWMIPPIKELLEIVRIGQTD